MALDRPLVRGDYEEISFAVTNPDNSARNITTDTIRFSAKDRLSVTTTPVVTKTSTDPAQIVKTNAVGGIGKVILQPGDLLGITRDGQTLHCDLVVEDSTGKPYTTRFDLTVNLDVSS